MKTKQLVLNSYAGFLYLLLTVLYTMLVMTVYGQRVDSVSTVAQFLMLFTIVNLAHRYTQKLTLWTTKKLEERFWPVKDEAETQE